MVCDVMISTLAGVCSGVRLSRLPVPCCVVALRVGDGDPDRDDAAGCTAPPAAAGLGRCREAAAVLLRSGCFGLATADGETWIGSSTVAGGACAKASAGNNSDDREQTKPRRDLSATEEDGDMKRLAVDVARHRERGHRIAQRQCADPHQDAPPDVLACDHD